MSKKRLNLVAGAFSILKNGKFLVAGAFLILKNGKILVASAFSILKDGKILVADAFSILKLSSKLHLVDILSLKLLRQLVAGAFLNL